MLNAKYDMDLEWVQSVCVCVFKTEIDVFIIIELRVHY